jgi:hypothetical protein
VQTWSDRNIIASASRARQQLQALGARCGAMMYLVDEQILRLQIPVENAMFMAEGYSAQQLEEE